MTNTSGELSSSCQSNQGLSNNTNQLLAAFSGNNPGDQLDRHHSLNMSHASRRMTGPGMVIFLSSYYVISQCNFNKIY